ncbi:MAG: hypothetical protein JXB49_00665 [Bacteroidales bacterium]|nr:hypothetical protein [Bacteroidales bacterium]
MKKIFFMMIALAYFVFTGCEKDSGDDEWSNKIELGTGIQGFDLTGVGSKFTQYTTIWFRLESKTDMTGKTVKTRIEQMSGSPIIDDIIVSYPIAEKHILVSTFNVAIKGSYKISAYFDDNGTETGIASAEFVIE